MELVYFNLRGHISKKSHKTLTYYKYSCILTDKCWCSCFIHHLFKIFCIVFVPGYTQRLLDHLLIVPRNPGSWWDPVNWFQCSQHRWTFSQHAASILAASTSILRYALRYLMQRQFCQRGHAARIVVQFLKLTPLQLLHLHQNKGHAVHIPTFLRHTTHGFQFVRDDFIG